MDKNTQKEYIEFHKMYVKHEKRHNTVMVTLGYALCLVNIVCGTINTMHRSFALAGFNFAMVVWGFKDSTKLLMLRQDLCNMEVLIRELERDLENDNN